MITIIAIKGNKIFFKIEVTEVESNFYILEKKLKELFPEITSIEILVNGKYV